MYQTLLTVMLIVLLGIRVSASERYGYNQITISDGLTSNEVNKVYKDNLGFLWISNWDGVHRYDGINMVHYPLYRKNGEISGAAVNFIFEDKFSNLWLGSKQGLYKYSRKEDRFNLQDLDTFEQGVSDYCLQKESILFGSSICLIEYSYKRDRFSIKKYRDNKTDNQAFAMDSFSDGTIAIVTCDSLYYLDKELKEIKLISSVEIVGRTKLMIDNQDRLWIANCKKKVSLFDHNGSEIELNSLNKNELFGNAFIRDIIDYKGKVWFATDGRGIIIYDLVNGEVEQLMHRPGDLKSLPVNTINDIFVDEFDVIYTASSRGGVIVIRKQVIESYTEVLKGNESGVSNATILSICESDDGRVWLGTDGGGLNCYYPSTNRFLHIDDMGDQKVASICKYGSNKLLVSFFAGPIRVFDCKTNQFESDNKYAFTKELYQLNTVIPVILVPDSQGNIWRFGKRLKIIMKDNTVHEVCESTGWSGIPDEFKAQFSTIDEIDKDKFLAWGIGGAYTFNLRSKTCEPLFAYPFLLPQNKNPFKYVYSTIRKGEDIWFVSSFGFYKYSTTTRKLKEIKTDLFKRAYSIIDADDGSFWIGSYNGLYRYFPSNNEFKVYGCGDGAKFSEFRPRSVMKSKDGTIYFGAVNGLLRIKPDQELKLVDTKINLSFANISIDGSKVYNIVEHSDSTVIRLPWDMRSLSVDLVVNNNYFFRKRIYKYQLEGFSDLLFETDKAHINFTSLPHGNYVLKVWCNRSDGSWINNSFDLVFVVNKPWWRQWCFITSVVTIISALFIVIRINFIRQNKISLELQVEKKNKRQQQRLNESKINFFTNVSHELRTPLSLIFGHLHSIVNDRAELTDNLTQQLSSMLIQATKMNRLIDQVLDIRKIEAVDEPLELSQIVLHKWVESFLGQFKPLLNQKGIEIKCNSIPEISLVCDEGKLENILSNILANAIKYSPFNGIILVEVFEHQQGISFRISDDGPGVAENELEKIFHSFYQAKNHKNGTGIGLAFSKRLVEIMGGQIKCENKLEGGALFTIFLPVEKLHANQIVNNEEDVDSDISDDVPDLDELKGLRILIVEDDAELNKFLCDSLSSVSEVFSTVDGVNGWRLINEKLPDVIISDVMMPNMDGFELCNKIKNEISLKHIPVLLLTAKSDEQNRITGYKSGADSYLCKPFSIDMLYHRLINLIIKRRSQVELFKSGVSNEKININNQDEVFLRKVTSIIIENIANESFGVNQLIAEVSMGRSAFYSKIKDVMDCGVSEYIKQVRINEAANLLKSTKQPVGEIAILVGFSNQQHFSRVFKDVKGCTPLKYRQLV